MISKKVVLYFPHKLVDQPIVNKLIKEYKLDINILKASITPDEEGVMVLELSGEKQDYERGVKYLKQAGIRVQSLAKDIVRNKNKCVDCTVCVAICPSQALTVDDARRVHFFDDKCIACELCIKACPYRAMEAKI